MFDFLKKKDKTKPQRKEQSFRDLHSVLAIIPSESDYYELTESTFNNLNSIYGLELLGIQMPSQASPFGKVIFNYQGVEREALFVYGNYNTQIAFYQTQEFNPQELDNIKASNSALVIMMKFSKKVQEDYHLQVKLSNALIPDKIGLIDENAHRILNKKWVEITANSSIMPGPETLYSIQAINDDQEVWLHTHGLSRCGLSEVEFLGSSKDSYFIHFNLLNSLATMMIATLLKIESEEFPNPIIVGQFSNGHYIMCDLIPWDEALEFYDKGCLGGINDRTDSHNSLTSPVFLAIPAKDGEPSLFKPSELNDLLEDNPLYLYSEEETNRMSDIAKERFDYVRRAIKQEGYNIIVKIGVQSDNTDDMEKEHLWSELMEIDNNKLTTKLTQDAYYIDSLKEGDINTYDLSLLTDWIIYGPFGQITPSSAYIMDLT